LFRHPLDSTPILFRPNLADNFSPSAHTHPMIGVQTSEAEGFTIYRLLTTGYWLLAVP
jgi:hypothetical protein